MNQFLLALQEKTKNEFPLYQAKFIEMCNKGRNQEEVYDILSTFFSIRSYSRKFDFKNADYFDFMYAIRKGTFLSQKFNDENSKNIMQKCLIYQDEQCIIFKPTNFEESRIIGEPICCFSNNKNYWDEHYNLENEAIYFVFEVMRTEPDNFVAITVRPNGRALVLNSSHEWLNKLDSIRFIQALGEGTMEIVSKTGNPIKLTENKNQKNCNRNMRNKKVVRLTESKLRNMIKESVKSIINEWEDWGQYDTNDRKKFAWVDNAIPKLQEIANQINSMWYDIGYSASDRYKNADGDFDYKLHTKHQLELLNQAIKLSTEIAKSFEIHRDYIMKYKSQSL